MVRTVPRRCRGLPTREWQAYMVFEVYERKTDEGGKEHSVRIAMSEGAHGMPLDTSLDAKHALQVLQRRCASLRLGAGHELIACGRLLIPHTDLDVVVHGLEDWGEDLNLIKKSTTPYDGFLPVEGDELYLGKSASSPPCSSDRADEDRKNGRPSTCAISCPRTRRGRPLRRRASRRQTSSAAAGDPRMANRPV